MKKMLAILFITLGLIGAVVPYVSAGCGECPAGASGEKDASAMSTADEPAVPPADEAGAPVPPAVPAVKDAAPEPAPGE